VTTPTPFDIADDGVGVPERVVQIEADFAVGRVERTETCDAFDCDRSRRGNEDITTDADGSRLSGLQLDAGELVVGGPLTELKAGERTRFVADVLDDDLSEVSERNHGYRERGTR
jgi:hypothetical protein